MKTSLIKTIILLTFLAALPARSLATRNDTIINYRFVNNQIQLVSGSGDLYQFAENQDGYKYIYYLFTDCEFLHLDSTDVKTDDSHYCLTSETQPAVWYNSQNFGIAEPKVKWTLKYEGDHECVKGNPHRCLHRLSDEPISLLFNADNNRAMKKDATSVLLYLMPGFIKNGGNDMVISLNFGGYNGKTQKDFLKEIEFSKNDTVLTDLEYVINRSNRVVIDSIKANNIMIPVEDNPHGNPQVVIPLKGIPISYNKDVNLTIYYRYFDSKGEIKNKLENKVLNLNWKKTNSPWWVFLVVIVVLVVLIIVFLKMFRIILSKRHPVKNGSQQNDLVDTPTTDENAPTTSEDTPSPSVEEPLDSKEESQESNGIDPEKKDTFWRSLFNRSKKKKAGNKPKEIEKKAEDESSKKKKKLKDLSSKELRKQLENANKNLEKALTENEKLVTAKKEAETQASETLEAEKKKIQDRYENELAKAREEKQEAEQARDDAEQKAKEKYEKEIKDIEKDRDDKVKAAQEDRDKQVKAAQTEAQKAKDDAARNIEEQKKECDKQLQRWVDDKKAMTDQLVKNVNHLRDLVNRMPPKAFDGNCEKIILGVNYFTQDDLTKTIESDAWQNQTTGKCLAQLRFNLCKTIGYGTDAWINLLGRLYSYLSVGQLKDQLSIEGLSFELISEAFTTMQAIMASLGIVVINCSPGFDSGNDPVTTSLFDNDSAIDRITQWLGSDEAVSKAVANHGHTVYDFGQLAYFTSEDLDIHKGSVIFYNS